MKPLIRSERSKAVRNLPSPLNRRPLKKRKKRRSARNETGNVETAQREQIVGAIDAFDKRIQQRAENGLLNAIDVLRLRALIRVVAGAGRSGTAAKPGKEQSSLQVFAAAGDDTAGLDCLDVSSSFSLEATVLQFGTYSWTRPLQAFCGR